MADAHDLWKRHVDYLIVDREIGFSLDISRMRFPADFLDKMAPKMASAAAAMDQLEAGAIANRDENRMVGHYWLRDPDRAPTGEIADEIRSTLAAIKEFAAKVHSGKIAGSKGAFTRLLLIGIGGSALGPEFVAHALGNPSDPVKPCFFDNTDPDGMDRVVASLGDDLARTLVVVISKSGGTPETRNGMLEAAAAFKKAGLDFPKHAVAVTQRGSQLDKVAVADGWLARFPMWDWVGGRTSVMSAVGLLGMAIQGLDVDAFLSGARAMDALTRGAPAVQNPAMMLAAMWYFAGDGAGKKDMVILPYKDRLELFSRYLQQLVMESLGKELDRQGRVVHQGIAVYGNKGSTDQHAYVQQLRDGVANFFVTFIDVLLDRDAPSIDVEPGITSGDYLSGLRQGTRHALYEKGRDSLTITIDRVSPFHVGALIALYERAVGFYAEFVDINAYHQPGVEAGKKAARGVLDLQLRLVAEMAKSSDGKTAEQWATALGAPADAETILTILEHLAANARGVERTGDAHLARALYRRRA